MHILVVDDHKVLLQGFAEVLRDMPIVTKVGECTNYDEVKKYFKSHVPDVVFLDLNLPPHNGINICRELRQQYKHICIVVLTSYEDNFLIAEARRSGANAYFLKSVDVAGVEKFLSDYSEGLVKDFVLKIPYKVERPGPAFDDSFALISMLSKREVEVLRHIARGNNHDEITASLGISYDTYKSHRSRVMQKLKLKNVAELVQFALRHKMLDTTPNNS